MSKKSINYLGDKKPNVSSIYGSLKQRCCARTGTRAARRRKRKAFAQYFFSTQEMCESKIPEEVSKHSILLNIPIRIRGLPPFLSPGRDQRCTTPADRAQARSGNYGQQALEGSYQRKCFTTNQGAEIFPAEINLQDFILVSGLFVSSKRNQMQQMNRSMQSSSRSSSNYPVIPAPCKLLGNYAEESQK